MNARNANQLLPMFIGLLVSTNLLPARELSSDSTASTRLKTVIQVVADPCTVPLNFKTVRALMFSDGRSDVGHADIEESVRIESLSRTDQSPILISVEVDLPDHGEATALGYFDTLVQGLRTNLLTLHQASMSDLDQRLYQARQTLKIAEDKLAEAVRMSRPKTTPKIEFDAADQRVYEQLQAVVDLSSLRPETKFSEAFDLLRHAVEPPLNIVVMWRDLGDNAEVDPLGRIDIELSSNIRLEAALDALVLATGAGFYDISYIVHQGQIKVGTRDALPLPMEMRLYQIPVLVRANRCVTSFFSTIQESIEPESWFDTSDIGEGTISNLGNGQFAVLQTRKAHIAIQTLLEQVEQHEVVSVTEEAVQSLLMEQLKLLYTYRASMAIEKRKVPDPEASDAPKTGGCVYGFGPKETPPESGPNKVKPSFSCLGTGEPSHSSIKDPRRVGFDGDIVRLEGLLGMPQLDPDASRIRHAVRQIEEALARIAGLELQIVDRFAPTVTVLTEGP